MTGLAGSLTQRIGDRWDVHATGSRHHLAYRGRPSPALPIDQLWVASTGFGYRLGRGLRFGMNLDYQRRESAVQARNYEGLRIMSRPPTSSEPDLVPLMKPRRADHRACDASSNASHSPSRSRTSQLCGVAALLVLWATLLGPPSRTTTWSPPVTCSLSQSTVNRTCPVASRWESMEVSRSRSSARSWRRTSHLERSNTRSRSNSPMGFSIIPRSA